MRLDGANRISSLSIVEGGRRGLSFHSPLVLSTIPIDEMNAHVHPGHVAPALPWRAIRIAYLHVSDDIDSAHETFYFPKRDIPCGRISFIKKYSPFVNPATRGTIITCEFPCRVGDGIWEMNDRSLGRLCVNALKTAGVVKRDPATEAVCSVGAEKAYPIYSTDWKKTYDCHKNGLKSIDNLCIFGRRGLFLHCNVDHAIRQGLEAADTISRHPRRPGVYWNERAESFSTCCARD
jgi:protoporphyrinogen oxidase